VSPSTWRNAAFVAVLAAAGCKGATSQAPPPSIDAGPSADGAPAASHPAPVVAPSEAPRLVVGSVGIGDIGWDPRIARPDDESMKKALDAAMTQAKLLVPPAEAGAPPPLKARVVLGYGVGFTGAAGKETQVDARVVVTIRWKEEGATRSLEARVIGQRPVSAAERARLPDVVHAALEHALADAAASLAQRDGIRRGDEATVVAALTSEDTDVRGEAFRAIGLRHLTGALPRLTELLHSTDHEVRDAAIGALVELGDRRAVKPLVDMVEFSDLDMMRRIIDAVGMIGGDEARDYLEFVASGHETPAVRQLAKDALERMKRHQ
jgi:hypothetical protein